jgi:allophanate hydrolase
MLKYGAQFLRETQTAQLYGLIKLPSIPAKPGLIRTNSGGAEDITFSRGWRNMYPGAH